MTPRYPHIRVTLHSRNPCALIGAVRQALREAGVDRDEIRSFSRQAFESPDEADVRAVCGEWARLELAD
jgi:hypothetical protein